MADGGPVPAGFLARHAAWSLDAAIVAVASLLLTKQAIVAGAASLRAEWAQFVQIVATRMADALGQLVDPAGLAAQLMQDAPLRSAAAAVEAALRTLLLPPTLAFAILAALYWIGFERSVWQATPGKRALALQVTDLDGRRLGVGQAAARHFAGALSWLTFNLGHALAAVPPQKRALHDYVAGTRVIHARAVRGDGDPRLPVWAKAWIALQVVAGFALVAWLLLRYVAALQAVAL
ncbi:MAG TPA: RDD family protein [Luteimonas sp.]|nr:RDD family protein [Luteimonas sp.]